MNEEATLTQLIAEMAQLRQHMNLIKQQLDMIYGAINRLAEAKQSLNSADVGHSTKPAPSSNDNPLSALTLLYPGSMLDSLHQHALNAGLKISPAVVDRLKSEMPAGEES